MLLHIFPVVVGKLRFEHVFVSSAGITYSDCYLLIIVAIKTFMKTMQISEDDRIFP